MKPGLLIAILVLLIRLPFLNQAVQGDDVYYLAAATHAQIDPAHPNHVHYIFEGRDVDFRGYPHPPLNAWCLAVLIAVFGAVREVPFHAAYILFSFLAAFAMWNLAKRFSPQPLWATLLFLATPAFVVNGNSFESDVPFLAFWLAGVALFISGSDQRSRRLLVLSAVCLGLSSLVSPQAVFAIPVLALYDRRRWLTVAAPLLVFSAWQFFEYLSTGQFPFAVATGYVRSYGLERLTAKLRVGAALSVHLAYLVWPLLFLRRFSPRRETVFLFSWIALVFAAAVAVFPAGSARYLLPLAAPTALLISRLPLRFLQVGFALQLTVSLLLTVVNYQHWNANRQFARSLAHQAESRRVWVNSEWGLRFYLEEEGARPVVENQQIPPGDLLVTSELGFPVPVLHGGSAPVTIAQREIRPSIPLRLIGIETRSAYSSAERGFLPFGLSTGLIDRLRAQSLVPKQPVHEYVSLASPDADDQLISGIYASEGNPWRWMAKSGTLLLKPPSTPLPIAVHLYVPDTAAARTITVTLDEKLVDTKTFPGPGTYTIRTRPETGSVLTITADKSFTVPSDHRELGIILSGAGFEAPK